MSPSRAVSSITSTLPASRRAYELRRVLKGGAHLFLFEHNPYNPLTLRVVRTCPFDSGVRLLRLPYATRIVRSAGFRVDRPRYCFFFPHSVRLLRPAEVYMDWLPLGGQYYVVGRREWPIGRTRSGP